MAERVSKEQMKRWDAEDAHNRIFGHEGHVDTAFITLDYVKQAARECRLTGINGALYLYNHAMKQLQAARAINSAALREGMFNAEQAGDNTVRIMEAEKKLLKEFETAVLQGCPCVRG